MFPSTDSELRDWFAGQALIGLLTTGIIGQVEEKRTRAAADPRVEYDLSELPEATIAKRAFKFADAMLACRVPA